MAEQNSFVRSGTFGCVETIRSAEIEPLEHTDGARELVIKRFRDMTPNAIRREVEIYRAVSGHPCVVALLTTTTDSDGLCDGIVMP